MPVALGGQMCKNLGVLTDDIQLGWDIEMTKGEQKCTPISLARSWGGWDATLRNLEGEQLYLR